MKSQTNLTDFDKSENDKPIHNHLSQCKTKKQVETNNKVFWYSLLMLLAFFLIAVLVNKCS